MKQKIEMKDVLLDMHQTYLDKNADYGNSFDKSLDQFGIVAALTRMSDKFNRLCNLYSNESKVKDESMLDSMKDLANYAAMTVKWMVNREDD